MFKHRHTFAVALVGSALFFAGCVDQKKEVALYRNVLDAQVPPTTTPAEDEALSLSRSMALANQNNEQLGLSGEDYVQALINKNRAVAAFLPTVSFQPSYTIAQKPRGSNPQGSVAGISTGYHAHGDTITQLNAPVVGSISLFNGFGDLAALKAAEAIIAQRRELLLDVQDTVLLNVAQTYYQVLRSEASVAVLKHSLELQQARLTDVQQQFTNGLATKLSVAQTQAEVSATRVSLVQAESDVRNGRSTLAFLIGLKAVINPLRDDPIVPDNIAAEEEFEQIAVRDRRDMQAAEAALEAAKHEVDVAVAEYYPSVSLNLNGFLYRDFYEDASKWNALLSANLPIFSAGTIEANVRTAWSQLRQAALSESQTRRQILNDVQVAYENLRTAALRIKDLQDEVNASQEAYNQARDAFHNGLAINLDVINAQDQLLNSQLQLTGALFDRTVFYLDLQRSAGHLTTSANALPTTQPTTNPS